MSQSPDGFQPLEPDHEYLKNFDALGKLIGQGKSFSGRERNCMFINRGNNRFADVSSVSGFDFLDDGRSLAITDWDGDGDLDVWANNRTAPRIRLLKNQLKSNNQWLSLKLEANTANRDAIGTRVELILKGKKPRKIIRTVRAGGGFLSQSSKWLHFGFSNDESIARVVVRWPGGSVREELSGLRPNQRYEIAQGTDGRSKIIDVPSRRISLPVTQPPKTEDNDGRSRLLLTRRRRLPPLAVADGSNKIETLRHNGQAQLLVLWASWCTPCLDELRMLIEHSKELNQSQLEVIALCTDGIEDSNRGAFSEAQDLLENMNWPFASKAATNEAAKTLTSLQHQLVYRELPLPLPVSFLIDKRGNVAAVYKGSLSIEELRVDIKLLDAPPSQLAASAFPFSGKSGARFFANLEHQTAIAHIEAGDLDDAANELQLLASRLENLRPSNSNTKQLVKTLQLLSKVEQLRQNYDASIDSLNRAIKIAPTQVGLQIATAIAYSNSGDAQQAATHLEKAAKLGKPNAKLYHLIGKSYRAIQQPKSAIEYFRKAMKLDQSSVEIRTSLAMALQSEGSTFEAVKHYRAIISDSPTSYDVANNLAWILATERDASIFNATEALELAQRVLKFSKLPRPNVLDTLAAAQAANKDFATAIETASEAMKLAEEVGQHELAANIELRLADYRNRLIQTDN